MTFPLTTSLSFGANSTHVNKLTCHGSRYNFQYLNNNMLNIGTVVKAVFI